MISTTSGNGFADVGPLRATAKCPYVDTEESASRQVDPTFRLNWTENVGSLCHGESGSGSREVVGRGLKYAKAAKVWRWCYRIEPGFA
jgi:hypothetical protein